MGVPKERNARPIPGYRLIEPLGGGGFGEVWKCEAPGGLFKAIKFVHGNLDSLDGVQQEWEALHHIKTIRHPFLLSMDRVEIVGGELVIVMELADKNLQDLLAEHRAAGKPGVPRDDLLGYLREAAEVLDLMNLEYGLQHLDIKPANLFLVSNHVKVADFGLVSSANAAGLGSPAVGSSGFTPRYAAPERFSDRISSSCDQYSLAIMYQELLTGRLPFNGRNARQLLLQHQREEPDLRGLPDADRPAVARALSKNPAMRFPCCMDFVRALGSVQVQAPAGAWPGPQAAGPAPQPRGAPATDDERTGKPAALVSGPAAPPLSGSHIVTELVPTAAGSLPIGEPGNIRHRRNSEKTLQRKYWTRLSLEAARLKLEDFRRRWQAEVVGCGNDRFVFRVRLPPGFGKRYQGQDLSLGVLLQLLRPRSAEPLTEVSVQIRPVGCARELGTQVVKDIGPLLLASLHACLEPEPEEPRLQAHLACDRPR
jgi:serine/threonine protein kinase